MAADSVQSEQCCCVSFKCWLYFVIDFSQKRTSVHKGESDDVIEVGNVVRFLLALVDDREMLKPDPCEVWRKVDHLYLVIIKL